MNSTIFMKKLVLILAAVISLSGTLSAFTTHWLYCNGKGQCYIIDQLGNTVACGGCTGFWATPLDHVILVPPTGNPSAPEASDAVYALLNAADPTKKGTLSTDDQNTVNADLASGDVTDMWVNPLRLTTTAYSLIYGGTTYLPLFYVNTALNMGAGTNILNLYSDNARTIVVTYKTTNMVTISSEQITVSKGSNSKTLSTSSLANGSYVITISVGTSYAVNLSLVVSH